MASADDKKWDRIVLHADMDAFYASVEQNDDPSLKGKPVVVGGTGKRGVVSAASYEARTFGVRSAMPIMEARRLCPDGVYLAPRFSRYQEISNEVMRVFGDFSPKVEPLSLDEAFLEMTGAERVFGPPEEMAHKLKNAVCEATGGLTVSVGAASTKFVAKVASDQNKPDGVTVVPPGEVFGFLHPLSVSRLWGAGPRTQKKLQEMGLNQIGDVAKCSEELLRASFGSLGTHLHRLANGVDPRDVAPPRERKSVGAEYTLEKDVKGAEAIKPHLRRAADEVGRRLREKGLLAYGVRVKLKTKSFKLYTRQTALMDPTDISCDLFEAGVELLSQFNLKSPMRLIGLAAFDLIEAHAPVQQDLFKKSERLEKRRLDQTLDTLREKFGNTVVKRGSDLEGG